MPNSAVRLRPGGLIDRAGDSGADALQQLPNRLARGQDVARPLGGCWMFSADEFAAPDAPNPTGRLRRQDPRLGGPPPDIIGVSGEIVSGDDVTVVELPDDVASMVLADGRRPSDYAHAVTVLDSTMERSGLGDR